MGSLIDGLKKSESGSILKADGSLPSKTVQNCNFQDSQPELDVLSFSNLQNAVTNHTSKNSNSPILKSTEDPSKEFTRPRPISSSGIELRPKRKLSYEPTQNESLFSFLTISRF